MNTLYVLRIARACCFVLATCHAASCQVHLTCACAAERLSGRELSAEREVVQVAGAWPPQAPVLCEQWRQAPSAER